MGRYPLKNTLQTGSEQKNIQTKFSHRINHSLDGHRVAEEALRQVDAWHLRDRTLSRLSGGERQRVYIARALTTEAPILLLDEPTSDLDLRHQLEIWHLLRALATEKKLVIAAVHDLSAAQRFCDQLVVLNHGRCHSTGDYREIITPKVLRDVFGVVYRNKEGENDHSPLFELPENDPK